MIAKDLASDSIIPLKTSTTGMAALALMDEYKVKHLPIVNNVDFLGLVSEDDIFDLNHLEEPIGNYKLSGTIQSVAEFQHVFDIIKLAAMEKLTLIPVVDDKNHYLGSITIDTLIECFAEFTALKNPGGIIVLERNVNDYSLTEISHIVESNDAKILCMSVSANEDSTKLNITLKINKMDLSSILQTFNRYDYIIKASYFRGDYVDDLKERWESLMNYLNI